MNMAVENYIGTSPACHSSVFLVVAQFHLCLQRTGLLASFWNGVSTQHKHYWSPVTSTMWHKGGWTDQKNGPCLGRTACQRKQNEGTKKGSAL